MFVAEADTVSHPGGNPSIGEASLSLGSGSQLEREADRESASMVALNGSILSSIQGGHRYVYSFTTIIFHCFHILVLKKAIDLNLYNII